MRKVIEVDTLDVFNNHHRLYNQPLDEAADTVAITDAMMNVLEKLNKDAKDRIKAQYLNESAGSKQSIFIKNGVSVDLQVKNGALRADATLILPTILKLGWKSHDDKPLTMKEINDMITSIKKQGNPSITIASTILE